MSLRIGLECGANTLKVAWVTVRGGGTRWHYREQPRAQEATPQALSRDLAKLLHPLRRHRLNAQLLLAAPESHVRQLSLQAPDLKRVPEAVRDQLPKLLPFEVERAQVQFLVRSQQRGESALDALVVMAACDRGSASPLLEALWTIGWTPSGMIPAALALVQTAKALTAVDQEPIVLMEIGERATTIVLVDAGEAVYARDVTVGDEHVTEALMGRVSVGERTLSLSREQAEALKREMGIPDAAAAIPAAQVPLPVATYLAMIQPILEQVVSEVRRTMTFGAYTAMEATPKRVVISGEGSRLPNLAHWLSGQLGVPVVRLNCEKFLGEQGTASAVVCGLALFDRPPKLDLQPSSSQQRRVMLQATQWLWWGLVATAMLVWSGVAWWTLRHSAVTRELSALQARSATLQPVVTLRDAIQTHTQLVQRLAVSQGIDLEWFRRLAQEFPNPVRLSTLSIDAKRQVQLAGEAQGWDQSPEAQISALTLWLERSKVCDQVELGSTRRPEARPESSEGRAGAGSDMVQFTLTCERLP